MARPEVIQDKDSNAPLSVYLTLEEKAELETIVEKEGLQSIGKLAQYAIKKLIADYREGKDVLKTGKRLIDPLE
jgi:hypothetical protein